MFQIILLDDAHLIDKDDVNLFNLYTRLKELPGIIVIILAGDADDGLNNQLQYRAQVEKQLRVIRLPNYTEEQLCVIFSRMVQKWFNKKMKLDGEVPDKYVRVLIRRLRRGATDENFTNIWPVKKAFIEASRRQVERFRQARKEGRYLEDFFMTKEDIMGIKPAFNPEKSAAWKELQELNGLDDVKESILSIVNQANQNYEREAQGKDPLQMTPNRVFLGNPGTGKTTVARLYGKILADFGVLSKGDLILKNPGDLIDRYIGWSERNTKEALAEAEGSVLIIDDAHMLDPGKEGNGCPFRRGVLDTLVAEVTGAPGEDLCVILCGYPDRMKDMYANSNPGLARRFPLDTAFKFEDFGAKKLSEILDMKLQKEKLPVTDKAREVAMDMLKRASVRPGFGNGGEVANLISKAALARAKRVEERAKAAGPEEVNVDNIPIEPEDFDPDWDRSTRAVANTRALFEGMIGFEDIIAKFESYQYMAQGMRLRNIDPRPYIPFTYVFKGPPGTGKTTTARKMGQIFYDMGLLAAPDVIDVSASQLVGEYCGQTGPKTMRLLESALGKVLFIDEAYRLAGGDPSSFQSEAVSELVDAVTKPKFARKLIIILAGYDEDMDRLMRVNPGLHSRFATELEFRPLRAEQHMEQLRQVVGKVGITIQSTTDMDAATRGTLISSLNRMSGDKGWASGRSVETLGETVIAHIFKECAIKGYTGSELTVTGRDLVHILAGSGVDSMSVRSWNSRPMGPRQIMTLKDLEGDQW
jgi:AAA+ superfamily predicted ATPase